MDAKDYMDDHELYLYADEMEHAIRHIKDLVQLGLKSKAPNDNVLKKINTICNDFEEC